MYQFLRKYWLRMVIIFILTVDVVLIAANSVFHRHNSELDQSNLDAITAAAQAHVTIGQPNLSSNFINLQPTIDGWVDSLPTGSKAGIIIYDLDNQAILAEHQANSVFASASLYKLFFVYDGFEQIVHGLEAPDAHFVTTSDKGSLDLVTCLDLMLRESYNGCADPMFSDTERAERVTEMITTLELKNTSEAGLYSTPADIAELLKLYYEHPDFDRPTWNLIQDAMLNQPPTTDDWRQGLPSGFSTALVYDKVGWNYDGRRWTIFNDAAIVNFPDQNRNFIIVVMTSNLPSANYLVRLGQTLEQAILARIAE